MALESSSAFLDTESSKPGLVFDADTITLSGKFTDELSAYRARKKWKEVFAHYFLLENERDYDMFIKPANGAFVLQCLFSSACGRYAFWRMINRQSPDAEAKLHCPNMLNQRSARFLLGSIWNSGTPAPLVYSSVNRPQLRSSQNQAGILQTVFGCLQKAFRQ